MRFSIVLAALTATASASTWFGKTAYNKWHETELERWLSDNNVPYPTPADRKDLEKLVTDNWNANVVEPYNSWDTKQLQSYLTLKGKQATKGTEKDKNKLVEQVKASWTETEDSASSAYASVRDWVFDSWSDSQLKAFLDKNGIPNPQPKNRDTLLSAARENYNSIATKAGETAAYPGNWLYSSWSESDLKAWLDERGVPVPQPSSRDKIIASVRRNSRVASNNLAAYSANAASSASSAAAAATNYLSDALLDSWSDSQIKEWADKNGIKVPQGSKRNELLALARKHRAKLTGDNASASASSGFHAATTSAGNGFAQATSVAYNYLNWIGQKLGVGASSASASLTSATSVAGNSAYSAASAASLSASSAASIASLSAQSAASAASKSGSSAYSVAPASASSASSAASKSASSASSVASKSASSASSSASKSASSLLSSISSEASKSSVSASKAASAKGSKSAKKAGDAAAESATKAKHRIIEQAQRATNYVREEL